MDEKEAEARCAMGTIFLVYICCRYVVCRSGVGNAAAAAALAAAPFRPKWCGKASSEPYISAEVGKG